MQLSASLGLVYWQTFKKAPGQEFTVLDIAFVVSTILCFAVSLLYVGACYRLKGRPSVD